MKPNRERAEVYLTSKLIEKGILEINDGYRAKNSELSGDGLPFARAANINQGFHFDAADRLDRKNLPRAGRKISQANDIVFTSKGTVGRFAFVRDSTQQFVYSPQLCFWRVLDTRQIEPRWLYFWMHSFHFLNQVSAVKGLTDMADYVSLTDQRRMKISVPSVDVQRRIASILGAYDDLIENNQRRIRILEEMAQRLYREWFVHFRFPGHHNTPLIDSPLGPIPKGWEVKDLGTICDEGKGTIRTGPFGTQLHQSDYSEDGTPVIMPKNIVSGRVSQSGIARINDEVLSRLAQHRLLEGDIVYGRRGDIGRHALINKRETGWLCGTGCLRISLGESAISPLFLHNYLDQEDIVASIRNSAVGSTMPNLNTSILRRVKIICPPKPLVDQFTKLGRISIEFTRNLTAKIEVLRQTRALLLPRLIAGEMISSGGNRNGFPA